MSKRIYIANKMTGLKDDNRQWFTSAAKRWRTAGWNVINPCEIVPEQAQYNDAMKIDLLAILMMVDAIAVGPDFLDSRGANFEVLTGLFLDLPFYDAESMERIEILAEYQIYCRDLLTTVTLAEPKLKRTTPQREPYVEPTEVERAMAEFVTLTDDLKDYMRRYNFIDAKHAQGEREKQSTTQPLPALPVVTGNGNAVCTVTKANRQTVGVVTSPPGESREDAMHRINTTLKAVLPEQQIPVTEDDFRQAGLLPG